MDLTKELEKRGLTVYYGDEVGTGQAALPGVPLGAARFEFETVTNVGADRPSIRGRFYGFVMRGRTATRTLQTPRDFRRLVADFRKYAERYEKKQAADPDPYRGAAEHIKALEPDPFEVELVRAGRGRIVRNRKRRRKLEKRGEYVRWSPYYGAWVWFPGGGRVSV